MSDFNKDFEISVKDLTRQGRRSRSGGRQTNVGQLTCTKMPYELQQVVQLFLSK